MKILDWSIIIFFFGSLIFISTYFFAKKNKNVSDFFLGGRNMPSWLVSIAIVGTSVSAGTFVGAPQMAFESNFTYLMLSFSAIVGGIIAVFIFIPKIYKANTITIYGYLGKRFGEGAQTSASIFFLLGQLLTSGSRLFIAAIAVSVMLYNDILFPNLVISIIILGTIATIFALVGGIKGLIYVDALQIILVVFSGVVCLVLLFSSIPLSVSEIVESLLKAPEGNKLQLIDNSFSFDNPYNLMGALIAIVIFKVAQYGTDHEFIQRTMTCPSVKKAGISLINAQLYSLPVVIVFMSIGFLLYVFYIRSDIMGINAPTDVLSDSRQVFPQYIFNHLPPGILGLTMTGLLAAALSSFDSAINAMTSSFISDIYLPRRNKEVNTDVAEIKVSKTAVVFMGIILTAFAVFAAFMQAAGGQTLIDFATGVMSFAYAGMLGVFLCAVLTKRGNVKSVIAALISGALIVLALQPFLFSVWTNNLFGHSLKISWPWWTVIGGSISFGICCLGNQKSTNKEL